MKFRAPSPSARAADRRRRGFTLAEALAALAFLAIVIPVAVMGIRVANTAGLVAGRKAQAARVADRVLNEMIVTKQWQQSSGSGNAFEGSQQFRWQVKNETWEKDTLRLLTVMVTYTVQGQDYDVRLSTVVDSAVTQTQ